MKKFDAVEGLRGWLAWAVVFSHLAYFSNFNLTGLARVLRTVGLPAVLVFIIISGFVITHLVIERPEPYRIYLLRRFMRIFPLFAVTCVTGFFATDLQISLLSRVSDRDPQLTIFLTDLARSNHDYFWPHALAHIPLLHGAISDSVLPFSQSAFNMPAWSLSVEWQFYLLAPAAITLARRARTIIWVALLIAAAKIAYQHGSFGSFILPSFLPSVAGYFAVGIASRLFYSSLAGKIKVWNPMAILAVATVLLPLLDRWSGALFVWGIVFIGLVLDPANSKASLFGQLYRHALESRAATYFGSRSFSTYLCHVQIITVCYWCWLFLFSHPPSFIALSTMTAPLTFITAELLYRGVERPGIALGEKLRRRYEMTVAVKVVD